MRISDWSSDVCSSDLAAAGRLRLRQAAPPDAAVTALPPPSKVKLGLVIDLDTCVGCHACPTSCKEWNAGGVAGPLTDAKPSGKDPAGVCKRKSVVEGKGGRVRVDHEGKRLMK